MEQTNNNEQTNNDLVTNMQNIFKEWFDLDTNPNPKELTKKLLSNYLGIDSINDEDMDFFSKHYGAICTIDMLIAYLQIDDINYELSKNAIPEILTNIRFYKDILLPYFKNIKEDIIQKLKDKNICPKYLM